MSAVNVSDATEDYVVEPYALPLMEGRVVTTHGEINTGNIPTAEDIETLIEQSRQEGFSAGHEEGFAQGKQEAEQAIGVLSRIAAEFTDPLEQLDDEVTKTLVELITLVAKNLIRRQLVVEPDEIVAVVQDAVKQLPLSQREIAVHLHPSDLEVIQRIYLDAEQAPPWALNADPTITQGGCMVETEVSQIDATVESRIGQIVATMIGDERGSNE